MIAGRRLEVVGLNRRFIIIIVLPFHLEPPKLAKESFGLLSIQKPIK